MFGINSYLFYWWGKRAISNECEVCNTNRRRVLQSHKLTIACSRRVKHVIFPNTFSENCTFTICFETGKWLFSPQLGKQQQLWNQPFSRVKIQGAFQNKRDFCHKNFFAGAICEWGSALESYMPPWLPVTVSWHSVQWKRSYCV